MIPTSCRHLTILCLCVASTAIQAAEKITPANFCTSNQIAPEVSARHCSNSFYEVFVLKSEAGSIGGYLLQPAIRDAPVSYLDCRGNFLASFHVFGSDEEKAKANGTIGPLNAQYPRQEALPCSIP